MDKRLSCIGGLYYVDDSPLVLVDAVSHCQGCCAGLPTKRDTRAQYVCHSVVFLWITFAVFPPVAARFLSINSLTYYYCTNYFLYRKITSIKLLIDTTQVIFYWQ